MADYSVRVWFFVSGTLISVPIVLKAAVRITSCSFLAALVE
jgi:hypothetical protein